MGADNLKLLVVDDEKEICDLLAAHLKRKGYVVLVANSAEEALPLIKEQNPEIALLDIKLPGMSGIDLLKLVRQFNHKIKVIMISGYEIDFQKDPQFQGLDILEFIHKPVPLNVLDALLEKVAPKEKDGPA